MKTKLSNILIAALALASVNLLVACVQKGNGFFSIGVGGPAPQSPGSPRGGAPNLGADGTSTSGGGTGIDGKVFESYIVDPTQLLAYKDLLGPLLANIKNENPSDQTHYEKIFKVKTWYIAPVELDKVSKDLLGVSFIKSNTQQIARQTSKEVWIDKQVYDGMNIREQGELLTHELVMNMYFFKFMTMTEICKISVAMMGDEKDNDGCVHPPDYLDKAMPAEQAHPLDDQDNANIRYVTGWLMQNAQRPIAEKDFVRILFTHGFDKRLFNPANYTKKSDLAELKISSKELYRAIKGAVLSGNMPGLCSGLTTGFEKACKVDIEEKPFPYQNIQLTGYNLRLSLAGEKPVEIFFFNGDETTLFASEDGDGGILYNFVVADWRQTGIKIGDRLYSGFMLFRKSPASQSGLTLDSIVFKPGIVTSIDKKRDPVCLVSAPKAVNLLDDGILVHQPNSKTNVIQEVYAATPPFAACSSDNVSE